MSEQTTDQTITDLPDGAFGSEKESKNLSFVHKFGIYKAITQNVKFSMATTQNGNEKFTIEVECLSEGGKTNKVWLVLPFGLYNEDSKETQFKNAIGAASLGKMKKPADWEGKEVQFIYGIESHWETGVPLNKDAGDGKNYPKRGIIGFIPYHDNPAEALEAYQSREDRLKKMHDSQFDLKAKSVPGFNPNISEADLNF